MSKHPKKKRGPIRRFFGAMMRCIALLICMGIICGSTGVAVMSVYIFKSLEGEPDLKLEDITMANSSSVYAINSSTGEYEKIRELHGDENRMEITNYRDLPQEVINCLVAAEDHRYWEHNGVDWKRTAASTLTFFTQSSSQGGSTITQQVIKNLTGNNEFSPERKIKEIFQAIKLNKTYSKEEVLKVYLNYVFFGNNCYGRIGFGNNLRRLPGRYTHREHGSHNGYTQNICYLLTLAHKTESQLFTLRKPARSTCIARHTPIATRTERNTAHLGTIGQA